MSSTTLKLRWQARGAHVHVDVFIGPTGRTLASSGTLVMSPAEMKVLAEVLELGMFMNNGRADIYPSVGRVVVFWEEAS